MDSITSWLETARDALDAGSRQAVATITRYVLLLVGFLVLLQTAGIDLTAFNVLAGAIGLGFELRAWSSSLVHRKGRLTSALNCAIYDKFNEAGIAFPFPQRDLHVRGGVLEVRQAKGAD